MAPLCSTALEAPAILETSERGKRHRSMQSIQSSASGSSSPLRPPAKRGRLDPQIGSSIGTSSHAELTPGTGTETFSPASHASEPMADHSIQLNFTKGPRPSPPPRPSRGNLTGRPSFYCGPDPEAPSTSPELCKDENTRPNFPSRWESAEEISTTSRAITAERPVSTYTADDICHIQLAAEYLEAMGYEEDAFSLYAILLKRLHEDCPRDRVKFLQAIIDYSRCVSTPGHCEVIQHHLRDQAQQISEEGSSFLLYQFLVEMALAETCSRKYDTPAVKIHLRKARQLLRQHDFSHCFNQVFNQLPRNNGSLDLVLYQSLRRVGDPYAENLLPRENPEEFTLWSMEISALEKTLYRVPGPFELSHREMGNPCIRLCLQWCYQKLLQLKSLSGPRTEVVSSDKVHEDQSTTMHRTLLFTCLWRISINEMGTSNPISGADTWMSRTHSRLGVNTTELLMITCAQIVYEWSSSQGSETVHIETELVQCLQQAAGRLLRQRDEVLAKRFLDAFIQYRTLEEGEESECTNDLRQRSRAGVMGQLENSLHTTFSQTQGFTAQLTRSTRRLSMQVAEAAKHMTMISSLRSSDSSMLNFRKVKESMDKKVKKLKEQPSMSSVSFGDSSRRSRFSIWTMSQLSQTMERTSISLRSTEPVASF